MNNYGLLVCMKEAFTHGLLDVIHFVGFVDPPTQEDVEKVTKDLTSSEEFMKIVGEDEWFLLPTVGLFVMVDNMLTSAEPPAVQPETTNPNGIVLPFGDPNKKSSLILPPGM